jgi:hypothetical protein
MRYSRLVAAILAGFCLTSITSSTTAGQQQQKNEERDLVARRADVYCTGFIADFAPQTDLKIVGAEKENVRYSYSQGDIVFLNRGRGAGVQPGAVYYVLRPVGVVKHPETRKKLGFYVRELGLVRVLEVQEHTSTAEVTMSCDLIEFGDMVKPYEEMSAPAPRDARPLARYSESNGGTNGQIVMSAGYHEQLSANRLVYLDLGNRQDVHPGDYFTIYREYTEGEGIVKVPQESVVDKKDKGYSSSRWRGGNYSVMATEQSRAEVFKSRPQMPRKVVGELIVIKCENNTSVALITRTTGEVNIGDKVERSN